MTTTTLRRRLLPALLVTAAVGLGAPAAASAAPHPHHGPHGPHRSARHAASLAVANDASRAQGRPTVVLPAAASR